MRLTLREEELALKRELMDRELQVREAAARMQQSLIQKRLELRRVQIGEECGYPDDSSSVGDGYDSVATDDSGRVNDWLTKLPNPRHSTPAAPNPDVERQSLMVKKGKPLEDPPSHVVNKTQDSTAVEQLAQALVQAVNAAPKVKQGEHKQWMARYSTGKDLPPFSGDPEEWPNFIAQFRQTSTLCHFNDTENMARLQKALKGKAKEAVQAFMVVPENVDRVVKTLERRFGRPELIIDTLIGKVQKLSTPKPDDFEALVEFADAVQNLTVTLGTLKAENYCCNPQLLREVVDKLPSHLKLDWARHLAKLGSQANLRDLAGFLEEVADAACLVSVPVSAKKEETSSAKKQPDKRQNSKRKETVLATTDNASEPEGKEAPKCQFCHKANHTTASCKKLQAEDLDARWKWVKEQQACFGCLETGHRSDRCEVKKPCGKDGCTKSHHPALHSAKKPEARKSTATPATETPTATTPSPQPAKTEVVGHTWQPKPQSRVLLRIAPVKLVGPAGEMETYALFDEASTVTLLDSATATRLGATGPKETLTMQWTNSTTKQDTASQRVSVDVVGADGQKFAVGNVRTISNLALPLQTVDVRKLSQKWNYLDKVKLANLVDAKPTILIGQDNCHLIIAREVIEGPKNGPVLSRTKLGWVVHGNVGAFRGRVGEISLHISHREDYDEAIHRMVKDAFSTESFGVRVPAKPIRSKEDDRAVAIMEETTRRIGDRWETGLLWKADGTQLPSSRAEALKRLHSIERKMDKDPNFAEQYCTKMEDYISKGYARRLTPEEAKHETPRTWYLPHFAVENAHKPGKIRLVFDAAATAGGVSLNDALLKGPDLLISLPGALCKLRQRKVGFTADIKEMFPQVRIRAEDVPAQRFLWRGMNRTEPPETREMIAMTFGATCSPCSAHYVKNRNAEELKDKYPEAAAAIVTRHYVDDYLDSTHSEEEAEGLITDVIEVHRRGGFQICNWACSSKEVLRSIPEELRAAGNKALDLETEVPMERVLGLQWDPNADVFTFTTSFVKVDPRLLSGEKRPTKREVLRVVMSVFDPLGFVAHFVVKAKVLLQHVWRLELGWDDELTDQLTLKWGEWIEELRHICEVSVPRSYSPRMQEAVTPQLHVFCDASEEAFAATAYLRIELPDEVQIAFVMAKTRVAPLKPMSIPRLELQAAVMGSRLAHTIREEHNFKVDRAVFWTDSRTVLCWLRSDARKFKTFVGHRIGEIEELTVGDSWRWVPTKDNVADDATRSNKPTDFDPKHRWWTGPSFL